MHPQFLLAALDQAWLGRGQCSPNPSVGAVAVQNNQIIAQTWHHGAGTPHAERSLLAELPPSISDMTLYVTLEPCNHWGKTPPCVDMIIQHGITRVVYAYKDPNPIVAQNNTPLRLKEAGIEVIFYPLPEIDRFYSSYHYWCQKKQPWVTAKIAQTFDGKMAKSTEGPIWLSNSLCDEFTHQQRLHTDIILTSARTIEIDNPQLNVRYNQSVQKKPVAILDRRLSLKPSARVFTTAKNCHIFYDATLNPAQKIANCTYHPITVNQQQLDLNEVITQLGELGFHDVWVEAGSQVFNALHQMHLVQRTYIYQVTKIFGETGLCTYQTQDFFTTSHDITWQAMNDNMIVTIDWRDAQCLPA